MEIKTARLYHSSISGNKFRKAKTRKADSHNLRSGCNLDLKENVDLSLSKNNLVFVKGKKSHFDNREHDFKLIQKQLQNEENEYIKSLSSHVSDDEKAELSHLRIESKKAVKRFISSSIDEEKEFWQGVYDDIGVNEIDPKTLSEQLTSFGKVKRFNNKISRLNDLENCNKILNETTSRNVSFTVFSKEILFKIPDEYKTNITNNDWIRVYNDFKKDIYPNNEMLYLTIHHDENPENPHVHFRLSGKNKKTGQMDIQDEMLKNTLTALKRDKLINDDDYFLFAGKEWKDLKYHETQRFGELYQDYVFNLLNNKFDGQRNDGIAHFKKRTKQEKEEDKRVFLDKHKPITQREHNRQKKLKIENDMVEITLTDKLNNIINLDKISESLNKFINQLFKSHVNNKIEIEKEDLINSLNDKFFDETKNKAVKELQENDLFKPDIDKQINNNISKIRNRRRL